MSPLALAGVPPSLLLNVSLCFSVSWWASRCLLLAAVAPHLRGLVYGEATGRCRPSVRPSNLERPSPVAGSARPVVMSNTLGATHVPSGTRRIGVQCRRPFRRIETAVFADIGTSPPQSEARGWCPTPPRSSESDDVGIWKRCRASNGRAWAARLVSHPGERVLRRCATLPPSVAQGRDATREDAVGAPVSVLNCMTKALQGGCVGASFIPTPSGAAARPALRVAPIFTPRIVAAIGVQVWKVCGKFVETFRSGREPPGGHTFADPTLTTPSWGTTVDDGSLPPNHHTHQLADYELGGSQ